MAPERQDILKGELGADGTAYTGAPRGIPRAALVRQHAWLQLDNRRPNCAPRGLHFSGKYVWMRFELGL